VTGQLFANTSESYNVHTVEESDAKALVTGLVRDCPHFVSVDLEKLESGGFKVILNCRQKCASCNPDRILVVTKTEPPATPNLLPPKRKRGRPLRGDAPIESVSIKIHKPLKVKLDIFRDSTRQDSVSDAITLLLKSYEDLKQLRKEAEA